LQFSAAFLGSMIFLKFSAIPQRFCREKGRDKREVDRVTRGVNESVTLLIQGGLRNRK